MVETQTDPKNLPGGLSVRWKSAIGATVFVAMIGLIVIGAGLFDGRASDAKPAFDQLPPDERSAIALDRRNWVVAADALRDMLQEDNFDAQSMFRLGYALQNMNKLDEAREWYAKAIEFFRYRGVCHYNLACINALEGMKLEAFQQLEEAFECGFTTRRGIAREEDFDSIKDEPEFQRLKEQEIARRRMRK